jgi:hypothetical protein
VPDSALRSKSECASGSGSTKAGPRKKGSGPEISLAIDLPAVDGHPNRIPFEGCLTLIDVASDKSPTGGRGHRVILTRAAAEAALPSLLGMAICYRTGWEGHDARQKVGIITAAALNDRELCVSGFVFGKDFPEVEERQRSRDDLGMSYELADARVENIRAAIWTLTQVTFTGAAVLSREKAAYRETRFRLLGSKPARARGKRDAVVLPDVVTARFVCASGDDDAD